MLISRRTVPIATDFETAISALHIPRPDDQLPLYRNKSVINPPLLPTPPPEDAFHNHVELPAAFLGPDLSQQSALRTFSFNIKSLPPLPSAHTYKATAVFLHREKDTRKIRELATEEGKLGEQALRKLASTVKLETALAGDVGVRHQQHISHARTRGSRRVAPSAEAVFEETMRDLLQDGEGEFELGPIVTSEKAYRMPDDMQVRRRPVTVNINGAKATADVGTTNASDHRSLSRSKPPEEGSSIRRKQPENRLVQADRMEIEL